MYNNISQVLSTVAASIDCRCLVYLDPNSTLQSQNGQLFSSQSTSFTERTMFLRHMILLKTTQQSRIVQENCSDFQYCPNHPICPTTAKVKDSLDGLQYLGYITLAHAHNFCYVFALATLLSITANLIITSKSRPCESF